MRIRTGSVTGTSPGLALHAGLVLPVTPDAYLSYTLRSPNVPPLQGSFGVLSAGGSAQVTFALPAGLPPALAGLTVFHAALTYAPQPKMITSVTNAVAVELVP